VQCPFLVGPSIYLRPLEREDARTIVPWFNDPEVMRYLLRYRPLTLTEEEEFLKRMAQSETDLALGIVRKGEDRLIGATGFHHIDARCRHASFGILLGDKEAWGKGYGTEATGLMVGYAFETLNLNRVWLHVYEYNERGKRAYEKVGFRVEGRLRQDTFRDGRYWDTLVMGILRDEWRALHRES
jgi:RimJ/RimL family protein N-acetyltransferase